MGALQRDTADWVTMYPIFVVAMMEWLLTKASGGLVTPIEFLEDTMISGLKSKGIYTSRKG
jgi:hypothetical protein